MAKALSKAQIAAAIADKAQLSKKQAGEILEHIAQLAYKHAKDTFTLPGIGKLVLKDRAARMGRNPKTGEAIQILSLIHICRRGCASCGRCPAASRRRQ